MTPTEPPEVISPVKNIENQKIKVLQELLEQFPEEDRKYMKYASMFLGLNAALYGLTVNNALRHVLNKSQAGLPSLVIMSVFPFITASSGYNSFLLKPLLKGDLNGLSETVVKGGLIGFGLGGVCPLILAFFLNNSIAARTASLKQNTRHNWLIPPRPVLKRMSLPMVLQGITGAYLAFTHHRKYEEELY